MESPLSDPHFPPQPPTQKPRRFSKNLLVFLLIGLAIGAAIGSVVTYIDFSSKLSTLQSQLGLNGGVGSQTYLLDDNVSLASLYALVKPSMVKIENVKPVAGLGRQAYSLHQGSGFVTSVNGQKVLVTNNHVIENAVNITVTYANGDSYPATVLGQDAKADLAVLSAEIPRSATGLNLVTSLTLSVGDPVIAVGSPYGLAGTLTTGIVSAMGRTISLSDSSGKKSLQIADTIQTTTPINAGNSGGPLLNYQGQVVGITTAGISNSEGLGFAIPSSTILRELESLVTTGSYDKHPSIHTEGVDMNYRIAEAMNTDFTYGYLVERVSADNGLRGGNRYQAILGENVLVGGDIIIAINNQKITNTDALLSYIERYTLPGQSVSFTVVRDGQTQNISVTIGTA